MKQIFVFMALLFSVSIFAQTNVNGKVTDAVSGLPIPGANVKIVGKSLGTTTDFDGNYSLKVNEKTPFTLEICHSYRLCNCQ